LKIVSEKVSASIDFEKHDAVIANCHFDLTMHLQSLMIVHVRWPAKNSGAFVFDLNFWFFWFKPKEHNKKMIFLMRSDLLSFSLDGKRNKKIKDKRMAPPVCPANAHEEYKIL